MGNICRCCKRTDTTEWSFEQYVNSKYQRVSTGDVKQQYLSIYGHWNTNTLDKT